MTDDRWRNHEHTSGGQAVRGEFLQDFGCEHCGLGKPVRGRRAADPRWWPEDPGQGGIVAELTSLPFQQCEHHIISTTCLRLGGLMVCVHGDIRPDGKQDSPPFHSDVLFGPSTSRTSRKLLCSGGRLPDERSPSVCDHGQPMEIYCEL
ncbi:uncharacterized protein J3R85_003554 [Psidium guajava]|nr:uncharacterized protein J3R85_003554 [Psidium guajava]